MFLHNLLRSKGYNFQERFMKDSWNLWIFYLTPEVQLNHFLHHTPKLGILSRVC